MLREQIDAALSQGATDIQVIPVPNGMRVFYRIDGARRLAGEHNLESREIILAQAKDVSAMDLAERRKEQFGEFKHVMSDGVTYVCAAIHLDEDHREVLTLSFVSQPFIAAPSISDQQSVHARSYQ